MKKCFLGSCQTRWSLNQKRTQKNTQERIQKSPQQIENVIKNNPTQLQSTIGKLHSDFAQAGHPASQHTASILNLDPQNVDLTLPEYTAKIGGQARLLARAPGRA